MAARTLPRSPIEALYGSSFHEAMEAQRERHVRNAWDKIMTGYHELRRELGKEGAWTHISALLQLDDVKPTTYVGRKKDHELSGRLKIAWLAARPGRLKVAIIDALTEALGRDPTEHEIRAATRRLQRDLTPVGSGDEINPGHAQSDFERPLEAIRRRRRQNRPNIVAWFFNDLTRRVIIFRMLHPEGYPLDE